MAMLVVLGAMSVGWMAVIAVLVTAQKPQPSGPPSTCHSRSRSSRSGVLIIVDPWPVPGLTPPG
jgi:predicted metal-binding membrane protein